MKMILSLEVELLTGTEEQLFQNLFDFLNATQMFARDPDGNVFLDYSIEKLDTVVISNHSGSGSKIFTTDDAKEIP